LPKLNRSQFKFRKYDNIGAEGAEEDGDFLSECFVDTGALAELKDTGSHRCIVVGRTGTGKTALLSQLTNHAENVARIEPDQLSLEFLANSTIIRHLEQLGVNLDLFYRLLWRHVLVVELIQLHYHLRSQSDQDNFLQRIRERFFGDKKKNAALSYLVEWGKRFWEDTELRIHEVTKKLEEDIKTSLGVKTDLLEAGVGGSETVAVEDRRDIVHRAQEVVNKVQIAQLAEIIRVLADEVFTDPQKRYYIVVDGLDENWVPDPLRYRLIRSLIEAIRDLLPISSAKVVLALRRDLLDRVFRYTRDTGFQEEKYQPYMLPLYWTDSQLLEVVDRRLNKLVRRQYTGGSVSWADLFPSEINKEPADAYIIGRTHGRPRDVIQFVNCCIALATDRPDITAAIVRDAEAEYSRLRLRSLADEWSADFPHLLETVQLLLRGRPETFPLSALTDENLQATALRLLDFSAAPNDRLYNLAVDLVEGRLDYEGFRRRVVRVYYDVGLIGIRTEPGRATSWCYNPHDRVSLSEIGLESRIVICPMFHRSLGTKLQSQRGGEAT
jgi:hypothetical protein